jgi:hypothetical protein
MWIKCAYMSTLFSIFLAANASGGLHLKVDLGLPECGSTPNDVTTVPGTVKEGWWPRVFWGDADMYMHDFAWEDGSRGADPPDTPGVDGSGVHFAIDCGSGDGGYHVHGMCRDNLGGGGCPTRSWHVPRQPRRRRLSHRCSGWRAHRKRLVS